MKKLGLTILALAAIALAILFWPAPASERQAWLDDYASLLRFTETSYANLGDRLASRKLSPRALDTEARRALAAARTRRAARSAVAVFVAAFDDHHFRAEAPYGAARKLLRKLLGKDRARESAAIAAGASGADACAAFGARDRREGDFSWAELPGFEPLPGDAVETPFPAGTLPRGGGAPLAVLRIGLFSAQGFPQLCAAEWDRYLATASFPEGALCDDDCQDAFWDRYEEALLAALERETKTLQERGATTLLVDLTGNGGGSSIVTRMARILTPRPIVRRQGAFIRHPHWAKRFAAGAEELRATLALPSLTPEQRAYVEAVLGRTEAMRAAAETPCDLSSIWASDVSTLPCSNVARAEPYLALPDPAIVDGLELAPDLLDAADLRSAPGVWKGDVWIATDRRTASASEDFVASLADSGAARLVGETTMGIGCGYTNGGVKLELPAIGMTVFAPDCVRYRADGRNEAEGIVPDVAIPDLSAGSPRDRAARVVAALGG